MPRKKKIPRNNLGIPEYEMESLIRMFLPVLQRYLASEERKRDWQEWQTCILDAQSTTNKEITEGTELNNKN